MLRTNILSITLLSICVIGAAAIPCPSPNYLGNVFSGTITITQHKSSPPSMVESFHYLMEKILNATITVSRMHLTQSPMSPSPSTALRLRLPTASSSLSSLSTPKVFLFFHSSFEPNGPILNGTKSPSASSLRIEAISKQDTTKSIPDLSQAAKMEKWSMFFYHSEGTATPASKSITASSSTDSK